MNILIVDDEQFAIQGMLDGVNWELLGFDKVLTACGYEEAVGIVKRPTWTSSSAILKCRVKAA